MRSGGSWRCASMLRISPPRVDRLPSHSVRAGSPMPNRINTCHMAPSRVPPGCQVKLSRKLGVAAAVAPDWGCSSCWAFNSVAARAPMTHANAGKRNAQRGTARRHAPHLRVENCPWHIPDPLVEATRTKPILPWWAQRPETLVPTSAWQVAREPPDGTPARVARLDAFLDSAPGTAARTAGARSARARSPPTSVVPPRPRWR